MRFMFVLLMLTLPAVAVTQFHPRNQRVYVHHLHTYVFDQVSDRSDDRQHPFLSLRWVV